MKNVDKKTLLALGLVVLGIGFVWLLATYVIPRALVTLTKAAPAQSVDAAKSYVIGSKILAKADGVDKVTVNVFLVDTDGKGVPGKVVAMDGLTGISAANPTSDNDGKVTFEGVSSTAAQYRLTASVGGSILPRGITVTFR